MLGFLSLSCATKNCLAVDEVLAPGACLRSNSGKSYGFYATFCLEYSGTLVIKSNFDVVLWQSEFSLLTNGLIMQGDGNLVAYTNLGLPYWASNTPNYISGMFAQVTCEGRLVVRDTNGNIYFTTCAWGSGCPLTGDTCSPDDCNTDASAASAVPSIAAANPIMSPAIAATPTIEPTIATIPINLPTVALNPTVQQPTKKFTCPIGFYCGTYTNGDCTYCYPCRPGYYCVDDAIEYCPAGYYSSYYYATSCGACPVETYQNMRGKDSCIPCEIQKIYTAATACFEVAHLVFDS